MQYWVAEPLAERRSYLAETYGVQLSADNAEVVAECDAIVLAVKPQVIDAAAAAIVKELSEEKVVISIAAGISIAQLQKTLGSQAKAASGDAKYTLPRW